jgi:Protein of unknown function (DUF2589)
MADEEKSGEELVPGEAAETVVSLSQILLAPLDAIFKAQVHAGRSFLNFVLQLSFGHKEEEISGEAPPPPPRDSDKIYTVDFVQEVPPVDPAHATEPPRLQKVSVPAIALVPLRPLAIQEAEFDLAMEVTWIGSHRQARQAVRDQLSEDPGPSPWYLVKNPISLRGHVAPVPAAEGKGDQPHIKVKVKLGTVPTPSGLDKLLTTLTQSASVADVGTGK